MERFPKQEHIEETPEEIVNFTELEPGLFQFALKEESAVYGPALESVLTTAYGSGATPSLDGSWRVKMADKKEALEMVKAIKDLARQIEEDMNGPQVV